MSNTEATGPAPTASASELSGVRRTALDVFRGLAILMVVAVVVQIVLAGLGSFGAGFDAHRTLGGLLPILPALMLIAVLVARPGWLHVGLAALLLVLTAVVQSLLASLGDDTDAWFGAMHALNALVIFGLAGWLAGNTRRGGPGATSR